MATTPFNARLVQATATTYTVPALQTAIFTGFFIEAPIGGVADLRVNGAARARLGGGVLSGKPFVASAGDVLSAFGGAGDGVLTVSGNLYDTTLGSVLSVLLAESGPVTYTVPAGKRMVAVAFYAGVTGVITVFLALNGNRHALVYTGSGGVTAKTIIGDEGDVFSVDVSAGGGGALIGLVGFLYDK